ncbi:hypothetical protein RKD27_003557 [Streptomyces sp. SAI-126]|jgi:hypothetical protein|nr:hypothetical protein [Streptomyces sp. SAI-119]MDH6496900.1 hypothetical protein [Streptomyces sp. SAI-149]
MKGELDWGTEYAAGRRAVPALRKPVSDVGHSASAHV